MTCDEALAQVRSLDFTGWRGLPLDCTRATVHAALGEPLAGETRVLLGAELRPLPITVVRGGEKGPLWRLGWEGDRLAFVDLDAPALPGGGAKLRDALG